MKINFFLLQDLIYKFLVYHSLMTNLINIYLINGKNFKCNLENPCLYDLMSFFLKKKIDEKCKLAVAVNDKLIKRDNWKRKKINLSDRIEIVTPFFGG